MRGINYSQWEDRRPGIESQFAFSPIDMTYINIDGVSPFIRYTWMFADDQVITVDYHIVEGEMEQLTVRRGGVLQTSVPYDVTMKNINDMLNECAPSYEPKIKDSGNRREFDTGAVRDMEEGKGRCDLLPACAILRLAKHYENGAKKYEARNWEKGIPISSFIDSGVRHLLKYMDGQTDEDHLVAATWNLMCAMWMEEKRPDLQDIPSRRDENRKNLLNPIVVILGHRQVGDNGEE